MGDTQVELPRFRCHKEVHAAKIIGFATPLDPAAPCGTQDLLLCLGTDDAGDNTHARHSVSGDWLDRHQPQLGGYFVVYEGGYTSFSPAEAFESGYARI